MADISNEFIKDSFDYVLQSDLSTGVVYRLGGNIPINPIFKSGLTVNDVFTYSDGSEYNGFVLTCDSSGKSTWKPVSGTSSGFDTYVTGGTYSNGIITFTNNSGNTFTVTGLYSGYTDNGQYLFLSGGTLTGTLFGTSISATTISGGTFYGNGSGITGLTQQQITTALGYIPYNSTNPNNYISGITSGNVTTALGYTPYNSTNPNGYISGITSGNVTTALGYTPYNSTNPKGYITGYTDTYVTGGTYSNGTATFTNSTGGTFNVTGFVTNGSLGNYLPLSGGTMSGGIVANSGVTANTISNVSYVDFTTGSTNPSSVGGRIFFDNYSKSLSYYDIQGNNVPIAMGQQLFIRVNNSTGVQIDKGKVISITGTTNGLPSAILAINNHSITSARPIGLAAENIPSNGDGLVITNGILSGITLNTFNNGDTLYLSPTIPGDYSSTTSSFPFSARTNEIGYVIQTGSTTGKIYVTINNEDSNLSLTDIERNVLEGNIISTGAYEYTGITQGTGQTINVAPLKGWVVKNTYGYATLPDVNNVNYTGGTNIPLTYLSTFPATYLLINSGSTLTQQTTFPTPQERRENIFIGKVVHPNNTTITSLNQTVDFDVSPMSALRDLWTPIKLINQGVTVSPHSTTLEINTSAGTLWGNGIGWTTNQLNPDSVYITGQSPVTFQYRSRLGSITGSTGLPAAPTGNTTTIDAHHYDSNGSIVAVGGNNKATNQRVYLFPTGLIRIQYGQVSYSSMANAIAGLDTETFVEFSNNRDNGILIGILTVREDAKDLSNTGDAQFKFVSKFGELFGGSAGISTTTLQQAYDNSTSPEIVINSILDGLTIKNGTGNADNVTHLIEGVNTAGAVTSFIMADGTFSGSTLITPSFRTNANGITGTTISGGTFYGNGSGFTNFTSGQITSALGYTPYSNTNPSGFTTSSDLTPYQLKSEKNQPNGYAGLSINGLLSTSLFPDSILGNVKFKGTYNGSLIISSDSTINNQPLPSASTGNTGWYFISTSAYTASTIAYEVGDWIISIGTSWSKVDNTDAVMSFNNRLGNITLLSSDITGAGGYLSSNPNNYISGITSGNVITALGYTPYNNTNPNGYISSITSGNVITALGYTPVTTGRTLSINGTSYDLSADRSWTISGTLSGLTSGRIPFSNSSTSIIDSANLTWDNTIKVLSVIGNVLTGSTSTGILNLSQTWNTSGSPTSILLNVINTASGASSKLMDLQISGSSQFNIDKSGNLFTFGSASINKITKPSGTTITTLTTGGTLTANTYYYKLVFVDYLGNLTDGSNELSITTTGSTSTVTVNFTGTQIPNKVRLYRGTSTGNQTLYFESSQNTSGLSSIQDTGSNVTISGTVPTNNNAGQVSISGNSIYVPNGGSYIGSPFFGLKFLSNTAMVMSNGHFVDTRDTGLTLPTDKGLYFTPNSASQFINGTLGSNDVGLQRNGVGVLEVNSGTLGTFRDLKSRNLISDGVVRLKGYTVATLPTGTIGDTAYVTDAITPTFLVTVMGGGSVVTKVFYNGSSWVAG